VKEELTVVEGMTQGYRTKEKAHVRAEPNMGEKIATWATCEEFGT
jgi:hypothetical protein